MEHLDSLCILFALCMTFLALTRCSHAWELVDKTELKAPMEVAGEIGFRPEGYYPSDLHRLLQRKIIIAMRCPRCGAAKIFQA